MRRSVARSRPGALSALRRRAGERARTDPRPRAPMQRHLGRVRVQAAGAHLLEPAVELQLLVLADFLETLVRAGCGKLGCFVKLLLAGHPLWAGRTHASANFAHRAARQAGRERAASGPATRIYAPGEAGALRRSAEPLTALIPILCLHVQRHGAQRAFSFLREVLLA